MSFSEIDNKYLAPQDFERAELVRECKTDIDGLNSEVCAEWQMPKNVVLYLTEHAPEGQRTNVLDSAKALQVTNPNVFSVPPQILPIILETILEDARADSDSIEMDARHAEIGLRDIALTDPALKDLKGRALLTALQSHDFVKERPVLQEYLSSIESQMTAIRKLAATPEEATALEAILDTASLYLGADNIGAVFSDVLVAADNSPDISEETKANIHKLFNIPTIKTASDLQTVLDHGYGVDNEGNKLPISQNQKLRVFPNTYLYEMPSGDRIFEIAVTGDRTYKVRFDEGTNEQALYHSTLTIQMMGLMAQMNLASAIWPRGWTLQEGGIIDLHYDDVITAKRVSNLMLGNMAGHDASLIGHESQNRMSHNFQAFPKKGDAATGDNAPDKALKDYKELTILNQDGSLNWMQFERAALYLQGITAKGGLPNFDDLKTYLTFRN